MGLLLVMVLLISTMYVMYGLREYMYLLVARVLGYMPRVLQDDFDVYTVYDSSIRFKIGVSMLDGLISWFSVWIIVYSYYYVMTVKYSLYLEILIMYSSIILSFIYPLRIYFRVVAWSYWRCYRNHMYAIFNGFVISMVVHYSQIYGMQYFVRKYGSLYIRMLPLSLRQLLGYQYLLYLSSCVPLILFIIIWSTWQYSKALEDFL